MMKKYWNILMMMLCCTLVFTGCDKDDDKVVDEAWKQANDAAFSAIARDPSYNELKSMGNNGSIYYKRLKEGEGTKQIYYTSKVKVYYTLWLVGSDGELYEYQTYESPYQSPQTFNVNYVVQGFSTALQYMHVGDRWEVWIPYQLGYGTTGSINQSTGQVLVPGYSTLKYEMEVAEIVEE